MRRWLALLFLAPLPALAQLGDPMRPPTALPGAEAGAQALVFDTGVQAVFVRPGGKSAAIINGHYVEVGGRFEDKRVLKITETEVVLKGEGGREVMRVIPAIEKTPAARAAKPMNAPRARGNKE